MPWPFDTPGPRGGHEKGLVTVRIRGAVQGVGFRPFVFRLAEEMGVRGFVSNDAQGVSIEAEGDADTLRAFLERVRDEAPPLARVEGLESRWGAPAGHQEFSIRPSSGRGAKLVEVLPDIATCPACLAEIFDTTNRRFRYPFTNCTNCGPRFSIIERLPYDRAHTSMKLFEMCEACRREYEDPRDRRFHAQPNACPDCGPQLSLWDASGAVLAGRDEALLEAARAIRDGGIVALKGLGGFMLLVDARDEAAVARLRERKRREEKPLALMCPDRTGIERICHVNALERRVLESAAAPITLLRRREGERRIAPNVAPGNPYLGVMLPYTPLHHLLLRELGFPVVATSGNLTDEPICIDEHEALRRLAGIADWFLVHDRPIVRHMDDSVARVAVGEALLLRRARGYAPTPVRMKEGGPCVLAVGAHLKNTVALAKGAAVFLGQHIGDLETREAHDAFQRSAVDLPVLYEAEPEAVACDLHPDYISTKYAQQIGPPVIAVQHHYAHVAACMAEHHLEGEALGVSWDGAGYGLDGAIWGGEFLRASWDGFERLARWRTFALPGGDKAVKEPRRSALGMLYEWAGEEAFSWTDLAPVRAFEAAEERVVRRMLLKKFNAPRTSSLGRLFDAVASLVGLRQRVSFEGQAAMELEFAATGHRPARAYPFGIYDKEENGASLTIFDWGPLIEAVLEDIRAGHAVGAISAAFHDALVGAITLMAQRAGLERVILTGGCFQNLRLLTGAVETLRNAGFAVYWNHQVPANDGGVALGQAAYARRQLRRQNKET